MTFARRALVRCRHGSAVVPVTGRAASLQGVPDPFEVIAFLLIAAVPVLVGLLIAGIARAVANRLPASPVVEFLPPQEGSIFEHALAVRADRRVLTAALIELAVQGKARVLTTDGRRGPVAVQVRPGAALTGEQREFLRAFRPSHMGPRQERRYLRALGDLGIESASLAEAPEVFFVRGHGTFRRHRRRHLSEFLDNTRRRMTSDGYTRRNPISVHLVLLSLLFLAVLVVGLVLLLGAVLDGSWLGAVAVVAEVALVFWVLTIAPGPLLRFTDRGRELRRHLAGLRSYMELAEQERLRVLQSPEGALRTPAGALTVGGQVLGLEAQPVAGDPVAQSRLDRFVLTEKLLPYAVLFRQEKQWRKEFERLGGGVNVSQHMRTLGTTFETTVAVVQAIAIVIEVIRLVGGLLSLFRN